MRAALMLAVPFAFVAVAAEAQTSQTPPATQATRDSASLERALGSASSGLTGLTVPAASAFKAGDREIKAGTTVAGPVAVIGTLRVSGTITGDAFAYGDVVLLPGGHITGSAVALDGKVDLAGGTLDGDARATGGAVTEIAAAPAPPATLSTAHNVMLTLGWATVVLFVGIGLLVFGDPTLEGVSTVVDRQFGKSFLVGLAATIGIVPVFALGIVGLGLTIIGLLLIPFAVVAYVLAIIGLVTLGFLATARVTGGAFFHARGDATSPRGAALRGLVFGVAFFLGLWLIAAVLSQIPAAASVARIIAFAITWAAATVGLGATIISRGGTRFRVPEVPDYVSRTPMPGAVLTTGSAAAAHAASIPEWQTPTPVSGVTAAVRRPPSSSRSAT